MSDLNDEMRGYFDATGNPVVLSGSSAFAFEIGVLRQALSEKDAGIERLKGLLTNAVDALEKIKVVSFSRGFTAKERVEFDEMIAELRDGANK